MKIQKILLLMLVGLFTLVVHGQGYAQEQWTHEISSETVCEKIYVSPDCIYIYPEGIFYLNEIAEVVPARLVASDALGVYVVAKYYRCPACGTYNRNNVCIKTTCPLYRK